jgi:hypothetical protein
MEMNVDPLLFSKGDLIKEDGCTDEDDIFKKTFSRLDPKKNIQIFMNSKIN